MAPRELAGAYDPSGRWWPQDRERRVLAALGEGAADPHSEGPLTVAWTGPQVSHAGTPFCVVDGAIYGLESLARRVGAAPTSVEAVVAAAYRRLGERLLQWLRGDFALLIWDPSTQRGLLARDQMGGRSLAWSAAGGVLMFGSEVRNLLRAGERRPRPDAVAMAHWLTFSGPPADRTLYDGIHYLEPGHLMRLGDGRWETREYWRPQPTPPVAGTFAEHARNLRLALTEAVGRRSSHEPATGVMLSGGLDSSSVAALATRSLEPPRRPRRAYSAIFPRHDSADESHLIEQLTAELGLSTTTAVVRSGSVLAGSLPYLGAWQLPPLSPNLFFWNPLLTRAAQEGIAVMLDGEGGDELFALSPALLADRIRRGRLISALGLNRRIPGADGNPSWRSVSRLMREFGLKAAVPYRAHRAVRRVRGAGRYAPPWYRPQTARDYFETDDAASWKQGPGPLWWRWLAANVRGTSATLTYDHVRRRAALFGIEARHPLVDVDVVELVLGLPPEHAFDSRHSRPLLRESVAGLVPDELRLRPAKSHFDAVFHESFAGPDLPALRALLGGPRAEVGAYVDLDILRRRLLDPPPPPPGRVRQRWALNLWRLATAECWLRFQENPSAPERLAAEIGLAEADYELRVDTAATTL